jgi:hypothetical protein
MHRVAADQGAWRQVHLFEQRLERGHLIALFLDGGSVQGQPQGTRKKD